MVSGLMKMKVTRWSHHGADPGPEWAWAQARGPDHGGEHLGGVDVADCQRVDGGDTTWSRRKACDVRKNISITDEIENENGPLVGEVIEWDKVGQTETSSGQATIIL